MTADRATLEGLLVRVEAATGPDRDIEWLLFCALVAKEGFKSALIKTSQRYLYLERWTSSIDDALALLEQVKPDANTIGVEKNVHGWEAFVSRNNVSEGHFYYGAEGRPTAALAILAALLKALIAATP